MKPEQLIFHDTDREKIRCGADVWSETFQVTLDPLWLTVVLERNFRPPQVVNSGAVVAKSIELEARFKNMSAQLLREVAACTSQMTGDDATTATAMGHGMNPMDLKPGIKLVIESVVADVKRMCKPCASSQEIAHVITISANNDRFTGELPASAIDKVGREGAISIEHGAGLVKVLDVVDGMQFEREFLLPCSINIDKRQSAVINERTASIHQELELATGHDDREKFDECAVKLSGGVLINVGAARFSPQIA